MPRYTNADQEKWNAVKNALSDGKVINKVFFDQFIQPLALFAVSDTEVMVTSDSAQILTPLLNRYRTTLDAAIRAQFGAGYSMKIVSADAAIQHAQQTENQLLNPKYTFENFVVGNSNRFAYASSLAVAEAPSEVYNPLFIYGNVGLGKTHLMNAIGNYILHVNPMAKVLFMTTERFTNEFITLLSQKKSPNGLRERMRNVDVLIMDDIQFISKSVAMQEEFFHTFNDLHSQQKQIILSSDRPPNELSTLEERIRSRFSMGLIVDIQKPDFETRVAILRRKADEEYIDIPYDVIEYIASHLDRSIRDLEGALVRVKADARARNSEITLESAMRTLESIVQVQDTRVVTPELILQTIARRYELQVDDLTSAKRSRNIVLPRQIAMYLCRTMLNMPTTAIGKTFGNRDHTTVLHGCDVVTEQIKNDYALKRTVEELTELVKNG